jgi:hypothetical protein
VTDIEVEQHRERCEVRAIIRDRLANGVEWARAHLDGIEKKRGKAPADRLRSLIAEQWKNGNRGERGVWK